MNAAQKAMTTWVGALSSSGVLEPTEDADAGAAVAAYVVGEERLEELRTFFRHASAEAVARERRAAVEAVIAMAQADRDVHPEESHLLSRLVARSGLDEDTQDELVMRVHQPREVEDLGDRLTHPVLRELILALAWELALADGRVDQAESELYADLARQLEVRPARAKEIAAAVDERVG
ncbi:MAG: TerB family tellurite resistance protein [Sandaracinaceae bacterium]|nr:TerB family tellurite resistance protein [Sandaracinaceae bacterium]